MHTRRIRFSLGRGKPRRHAHAGPDRSNQGPLGKYDSLKWRMLFPQTTALDIVTDRTNHGRASCGCSAADAELARRSHPGRAGHRAGLDRRDGHLRAAQGPVDPAGAGAGGARAERGRHGRDLHGEQPPVPGGRVGGAALRAPLHGGQLAPAPGRGAVRPRRLRRGRARLVGGDGRRGHPARDRGARRGRANRLPVPGAAVPLRSARLVDVTAASASSSGRTGASCPRASPAWCTSRAGARSATTTRRRGRARDRAAGGVPRRAGLLQVPRSVDFTDELPREPNGKLYKRRLRERYWAGHESPII
jgi:hypothetical protein